MHNKSRRAPKDKPRSLSLKQIPDAGNKGLFLIGSDGRILKINKAFTDILGYAARDIRQLTFIDLKQGRSPVQSDTEKRIRQYEFYYLYMCETEPSLFMLTGKHGESIPVHMQSVISCDADNKLYQAIGIIEKVDKINATKKSASQASSNREVLALIKDYKNILDNTADAIIVFDLNSRIVTVNPATERMLCFTNQELLGMLLVGLSPKKATYTCTTGELITIDDKWVKQQTELYNQLFQKGRIQCQSFLLRKDGKVVPVEMSLSVMKGSTGKLSSTISICRDITQRMLVENKLAQAYEDLEKKVVERTIELEEANTALRVLLKRIDHEKTQLGENIMQNIHTSIAPYIDKIKKGQLDPESRKSVDVLEENLETLLSPFSQSLSSPLFKLTSTEIKVANLIRLGKPTKEIAHMLNISFNTAATHRNNIRNKIGLRNKKEPLKTHLQSFT